MSPVVVTPAVLRDHPLPRPGADKHARGQVLVLGGAVPTPGALRLAGEGALRAGAGKLALATVERHVGPLGTWVPESSVIGLPERGDSIDPGSVGLLESRLASCDALLVGPGFVEPDPTLALCEQLAGRVGVPVVLDALATAYLGEHPDAVRRLGGQVVATVNPGELQRLNDGQDDGTDPEAVQALADRLQAVVLCGGPEKVVAAPGGRCWLVQGGGPGLGVSGSGDVQAGIVAGLLARGCDIALGAWWGAYLHARAGERLAARTATVGFLARELPGEVPLVLRELG